VPRVQLSILVQHPPMPHLVKLVQGELTRSSVGTPEWTGITCKGWRQLETVYRTGCRLRKRRIRSRPATARGFGSHPQWIRKGVRCYKYFEGGEGVCRVGGSDCRREGWSEIGGDPKGMSKGKKNNRKKMKVEGRDRDRGGGEVKSRRGGWVDNRTER
jgi:hypothetical protein